MLHAPVLTSWSGRGARPRPLPGLAATLIKACDLVRNGGRRALPGLPSGRNRLLGQAPSWRAAEKQSMIRVDLDERALDLNRPASLAIRRTPGAFYGSSAKP
jgi:hypothetical protein